MKMKRKVGRPKLDRPRVERRLISILKEDAQFIQTAAKGQHRSVTQVINLVTGLWRQGMPALLNNMGTFSSRDEDPGHERVPGGTFFKGKRRKPGPIFDDIGGGGR